jgi:hypothetical protein
MPLTKATPKPRTRLASCNLKGQGVPQDYAEAMRWYRLAANQGEAEAQANIGYLYAHGLGVPQDCAVATEWIGRAAAAGNSTGQFFLKSGVGSCDLPQRVGDCVNTTVKSIGEQTSPVGSSIEFKNGGFRSATIQCRQSNNRGWTTRCECASSPSHSTVQSAMIAVVFITSPTCAPAKAGAARTRGICAVARE